MRKLTGLTGVLLLSMVTCLIGGQGQAPPRGQWSSARRRQCRRKSRCCDQAPTNWRASMRQSRKLIDTDKSDVGPLLKKYQPLLVVQPPRLNTAATYTQTALRMGPRHEGFVEIAKAGNIDLLLHGDSITDWWVQGDANKAMFEKYFGGNPHGELRDRGRHDAGRAVGSQERRRPGLPAQGRDADDRHEQHWLEHAA
jgi:hypothetical protein